jgi:hypothetical protein
MLFNRLPFVGFRRVRVGLATVLFIMLVVGFARGAEVVPNLSLRNLSGQQDCHLEFLGDVVRALRGRNAHARQGTTALR